MLLDKVIDDKLIVIDEELLVSKTETGLHMADTTEDRYVMKKAKVLAVGPKCTQVKAHDVIAFTADKGVQFRYRDVVYKALREDHVEFVINPDELITK